jgi:hypothetical protein
MSIFPSPKPLQLQEPGWLPATAFDNVPQGETRATQRKATTISSFPAPRPPLPQELAWPLAAVLDRVSRAKSQATLEKAKENAISAKIIYHLLVQLDERRGVLGDKPCARVIDELVPSLQDDDNSLIFELGQRYRDHLIRACAFSRFSVFFILT